MSEAAENKANNSPRKPVLRTIPSTSNTLGKLVVVGRALSKNADMGKHGIIPTTPETPKIDKHVHVHQSQNSWEHTATPIPPPYPQPGNSLVKDTKMSAEGEKFVEGDYFSSKKGFGNAIPTTPFGKAIRAGIISPLTPSIHGSESSSSFITPTNRPKPRRIPASNSTPNPDLNLTPKARNSLLSILPATQRLDLSSSDSISGSDDTTTTTITTTLQALQNDFAFTPATAGSQTTNPTTELIHKVFHNLLLSLSSVPTGAQSQAGLKFRLPPQKPILQALLTARTTLIDHFESMASPSTTPSGAAIYAIPGTGNTTSTLDPQYHHEALTKREQKLREKDMQVYLREEEFGHYCADKDVQIRKRIQELDLREKMLAEREKAVERQEMALALREEWIMGWNEMKTEQGNLITEENHGQTGDGTVTVVVTGNGEDHGKKFKQYIAKHGGTILTLTLLVLLYFVGVYFLVLVPLLDDLMDGLSWLAEKADIDVVGEHTRMVPGIGM